MRNYQVKTVTVTPPWVRDAIEGDYSGPGMLTRNRITTVQESYARVPLLFRGVRIRANSLLNIPRHINKLNSDGTKTETTWPFPIDLEWLLWRMQASILLAGGSVVVKARNEMRRRVNGPPQDLQWLNPFSVSIRWDATLKKRIYMQAGQLLVGGETHTWTDDDVVFAREYAPLDDVGWGVPAALVALQSSKVAFSIPQMAAQFFENGAMPVTMVSVAEGTDPDEVKKVEGFFGRLTQGILNAYRVIAVRGDVKITSTQNRMKDNEAPSLKDEARKDIARALEMPVTLLDSDETFATAIEHKQSFYMDTVYPSARMVGTALNRDVLNPMGLELDFALQEMSIFQKDEAERAAAYKSYVDSGMPPRVASAVLGLSVPEEVQKQWDAMYDLALMEKLTNAAKTNLISRDEWRTLLRMPKTDNTQVYVGVTVRLTDTTEGGTNPVTGNQLQDAPDTLTAEPNPKELPAGAPPGTGEDPDEQQLQERAKQKAIETAQFRKYVKKRSDFKAAHPFVFRHLDEAEQAQLKQDMGMPADGESTEEKRRKRDEQVLLLALLALLSQYPHDGNLPELRAAFIQELRLAYHKAGATDAEVEAAIAEQTPYLDGFLADVVAGKQSPAQREARVKLYAGSLGAMQQRVMLRELGDTLLRWVYQPGAEHCKDCLELDGTIQKASEWLALGLYPRSGKTECLTACQCRMEKAG
jgi:HK97 family phage portal protein